MTHTSSSTRVLFKTKVVIPGKIFTFQTGRIPSWTYSKADVYRGTTVVTYSFHHAGLQDAESKGTG
jgi:hypothetical protein